MRTNPAYLFFLLLSALSFYFFLTVFNFPRLFHVLGFLSFPFLSCPVRSSPVLSCPDQVCLSSPAAPYLGKQLLSYGQNLSFSLRLDRGVRHPSTNDVILEGAGQRVSASLGDLRSIVPCGQKLKYSFRSDNNSGQNILVCHS